MLEPDTINALVSAASGPAYPDKSMFVPTVAGKRGHPVLLRMRIKSEILSLPSTVGLDHWRDAHPDSVEFVPVNAPGIAEDIDTPEDYQRALRRMEDEG